MQFLKSLSSTFLAQKMLLWLTLCSFWSKKLAVASILEGYPHGLLATGCFFSQNEQNLSHSNNSSTFELRRSWNLAVANGEAHFDPKMLLWRTFWKGTLTVRLPQDVFFLPKRPERKPQQHFDKSRASLGLQMLLWLRFGEESRPKCCCGSRFGGFDAKKGVFYNVFWPPRLSNATF